MTAKLDPRLNAIRADLADRRLQDRATAPRYVDGAPARVSAGLAPVWRMPDDASELDTYFFCGEPILVFDRAMGYAWCQSAFDGYVGYLREAHVAPASGAGEPRFVATMGSYRYETPDLRTRVLDFLPRHAQVAVVEAGIVTRNSRYVRLADGGFVLESCLAPTPPRSRDIVEAAARYLGCPYLWAGKSFLGIDCSGLVQNAFRDIGETVLRDTDMQRDGIGERVAVAAIDELQRGDLLYMPGHVVIYEGEGSIIHADGKTMMVQRESLAGFCQSRELALAAMTVRRRS